MPKQPQGNLLELVRQAQDEASLLADVEQTASLRQKSELPLPSIEGYRIEVELHRGAQGVVYRATELTQGTAVAIKVLGAGRELSASDRVRFAREIEILQTLCHPNIVPVLAEGTLPGEDGKPGRAYFVMPLVEGDPLIRAVDTMVFDRLERVAIFLRAVEAVEAAHRVGVIHRDLKPANILVDRRRQVHLIDFGLSKRPIWPDELDATLTHSHQFIGSLPWSSPEHVSGGIDVRSDVYSLGIILYQLVVGSLPYSLDGGPLAVLERIRDEAPEAPRLLDRSIDRDLETIILTCLQKDPARRYQSAAELKEDLTRYLAGEPIVARRDSLWALAKSTWRRHRLGVSLALGCWIGGMLFGVGALWQMQSLAARQHLAEQQAQAARQAQQAAEQQLATLQSRAAQPASWVSAFETSNELSTMPPEEGWRVMRETWPKLDNVQARQQFLKAIAFSRHPFTHRGLNLGINDPSPQVRSWACIYLAEIALFQPAVNHDRYQSWYTEAEKLELSQVLAQCLTRTAAELAKSPEAPSGSAAAESLGLLAANSSLRQGDMLRIRQAVAESHLAERLLNLATHAGAGSEVRSQAFRALAKLPLDTTWVREKVAPLITDAKNAAEVAGILGAIQERWVVELLVAALPRAVARRDDTAVSNIAAALADQDDSAAIPAMIESIAADNEYRTVYGIGYFGLNKLTGVPYDAKHDGAWWRRWWSENKDRISAKGDVKPLELAEVEPVADEETPAEDSASKALPDEPRARYYLFEGGTGAAKPAAGYKLLVVLPGGDGGSDFRPFVQAIARNCLNDDFLLVELIAPRWHAKKFEDLVWPTQKSRYAEVKFTTEEFIRRVLDEVKKEHKLADELYLLGWSSGGLAVYAAALDKDLPVKGAFVAMSIFRPRQLPDLQAAKGKAFYLLHSPTDFIKMRQPEDAREKLSAAGAVVRLDTYEGGHGWHGDVMGNIRQGIEWIQEKQSP
jgi:predicted esterase/type II secretory pathway pseudopilin PulG